MGLIMYNIKFKSSDISLLHYLKDPTIYSTILSLIGASLVTSNDGVYRFGGFSTWIVSNIIWCAYFIKTEQYNPAALFAVYLITSMFGAYNNYIYIV